MLKCSVEGRHQQNNVVEMSELIMWIDKYIDSNVLIEFTDPPQYFELIINILCETVTTQLRLTLQQYNDVSLWRYMTSSKWG